MKRMLLCLMFLCAVLCCPCFAESAAVPAADSVATAAVATAPAAAAPSILETVWAFLNSNVGLTLIGGVLVWILGLVFTAKPAWKVVYDKYQPLGMQAVKAAEKAIPDNTTNTSVARLDYALKYLIQLNGSVAKHDEAAVKQALTQIHADAEAAGNI